MRNTKVIEQKLSSALILLANIYDKISEIKDEICEKSMSDIELYNQCKEKIIPKGFTLPITAEDYD